MEREGRKERTIGVETQRRGGATVVFHDLKDALFAAVKLFQTLTAALHDAGQPLQLCTWFRRHRPSGVGRP